MRRLFRRWVSMADDERGTSLTEFTITMPIFIMVMVFVYYMGAAGHVLTQETAQAQRLLWNEVMDYTYPVEDSVGISDPDNPHTHPVSAEEVDREFLNEVDLQQRRAGLAHEVEAHDIEVYGGVERGGHWGSSFQRTRPAHETIRMGRDADQMTDNPRDVVGESRYAQRLVDDTNDISTGPRTVQMGVGGVLSSGIPREGTTPVLGAGMRYGVANMTREGTIQFGERWSMPVRVHYDVMVPPTPMIHNERETSEVARNLLDEQSAYGDLLGIQNADTYSSESPAAAPDWPQD